MSVPVKAYGLGVLYLPVGFFVASTLEDQIDILYSAADNPATDKSTSESFLRFIGKIAGSIGQG